MNRKDVGSTQSALSKEGLNRNSGTLNSEIWQLKESLCSLCHFYWRLPRFGASPETLLLPFRPWEGTQLPALFPSG